MNRLNPRQMEVLIQASELFGNEPEILMDPRDCDELSDEGPCIGCQFRHSVADMVRNNTEVLARIIKVRAPVYAPLKVRMLALKAQYDDIMDQKKKLEGEIEVEDEKTREMFKHPHLTVVQ